MWLYGTHDMYIRTYKIIERYVNGCTRVLTGILAIVSIYGVSARAMCSCSCTGAVREEKRRPLCGAWARSEVEMSLAQLAAVAERFLSTTAATLGFILSVSGSRRLYNSIKLPRSTRRYLNDIELRKKLDNCSNPKNVLVSRSDARGKQPPDTRVGEESVIY